MTEPTPKAPRENNWWVKSLNGIRAVIKAQNTDKLPGTIHLKVAKILKDSGKLSSTLRPSEADIIAAFNSFLSSTSAPNPTPLQTDMHEERSTLDVLHRLLSSLEDGDEVIISRRRRCSCRLW
jgi:hypothetical protein